LQLFFEAGKYDLKGLREC